MSRKITYFFAIAASLLFFFFFFLLPVCKVLKGGMTDFEGNFSLYYLQEIFRNPLYRDGLLNSFLIATATTFVSLLIAMPLAYLSANYDFSGKKLLNGVVLLPMILAPFVGTIGMRCIFGKYGAFNALLTHLGIFPDGQGPDWFASGFLGVVGIEALHLFPILYLNISAALANIDPMLLEAAMDYNCTGFKRFCRITLPLARPGIFAGASLVFIWAFTELGTPLMFNYRRLTTVQIFNGLSEIGRNPMPYALVTVMMLCSIIIFAIAKLIFGKNDNASTTKAGRIVTTTKLHGWKNLLTTAYFMTVGFVCILPHLGVLGLTFGKSWYKSVFPNHLTLEHLQVALGHNLTIPSIINSVRYSCLAVVVVLMIAIFYSYVIVRGNQKFGQFLDMVAMSPLAVPGLVLAFGYLAMGQPGNLFAFCNPIDNPTFLLVIAYAIRRMPYLVRSAVAGLQQTSASFEEAAASLGASPLTSFRRITVPLICANLLAGIILIFSFSMLEVSDSLILAQKNVFFPITRAMYALSGLLGEGINLASALGLWTMLFLGLSMITISIILGKKMGAIFKA